MLIVLALILLFALVGGGIYLWVKRQRRLLLKKKMDLAESSKTLDSGGPSVLDSVGSPVSKPTTSSASDRPQINAPESGGANGGVNGGTPDDTNSVDKSAAVVDPPVDSKFGARFRQAAPTIKELATKLMEAWNEASVVHNAEESAWYKVKEFASTIVLAVDCRFLYHVPDATAFVEGSYKHYAQVATDFKTWYDFSRQVKGTAEAAGAAFEALRQALKPYDKSNVVYLPPDLQGLCISAHNVLETSKRSIENLLKEVQECTTRVEAAELKGEPLKRDVLEKLFVGDEKTFAEGTHADDLDDTNEARASLKQALVEAITNYQGEKAAFDELSANYSRLEELGKQSFVFPKKPTPEEIQRFLTELEEWSKNKLAGERKVGELIAACKRAIKSINESVKALKRTRGRTSPVLHDAKRTVDEGLLLAANKAVADLEKGLAEFEKTVAKAVEEQPKVSAPTPTATAVEDVAIKSMRGHQRTVAFALAQKTVAAAKLALTQQNEPLGSARAPRIERSEAFEKYLELNLKYLAQTQVEAAEHDKWEEGRDLVQMAFEARQAKLVEATKDLASRMAEVQKTSSATPADELLVVNGVAAKIVQLVGI